MEQMIVRGIELGLTKMCFTEHNDFDYPVTETDSAGKFELNPDAYLYDFLKLREKYDGQITLCFGLELGLQAHLARKNAVFAKAHEYDFIIGSSHICNGQDPYYPAFYEGREQSAAYLEYFESILDNLKGYSNFDVYGHLDYVVRYGPQKKKATPMKPTGIFWIGFWNGSYPWKRELKSTPPVWPKDYMMPIPAAASSDDTVNWAVKSLPSAPTPTRPHRSPMLSTRPQKY